MVSRFHAFFTATLFALIGCESSSDLAVSGCWDGIPAKHVKDCPRFPETQLTLILTPPLKADGIVSWNDGEISLMIVNIENPDADIARISYTSRIREYKVDDLINDTTEYLQVTDFKNGSFDVHNISGKTSSFQKCLLETAFAQLQASVKDEYVIDIRCKYDLSKE